MIRFVQETFTRLIDELTITQTRYLYPKFNLKNRLTGLVGPRGVGKTTLLLQYIKNELHHEARAFYFSADMIYFQQATLLEFVSQIHQIEGYKTIFIDEIHKYKNWNQELKNIYDAFPSLKIVFSGSSMLDLIQGSADLSRRAKLFHLRGMSFREYLNFVTDQVYVPISMQDLKGVLKISSIPQVILQFKKYLQHGYYPFVFEDEHSYYENLSRIIDKIIFEDISAFYQLKTPNLHYFKRILTFLGSIPPGEVSIHNISHDLGIDHKTVEHYLSILESVGLVRLLHPFMGGSQALRKSHKIFLNNTTLMHTLKQYHGQDISKGTERELFFVQALQDAGEDIFFTKIGDFRTRNSVFEVGGKNKDKKQLRTVEGASFLVKDDILTPLKGEIPLFYFGFLY